MYFHKLEIKHKIFTVENISPVKNTSSGSPSWSSSKAGNPIRPDQVQCDPFSLVDYHIILDRRNQHVSLKREPFGDQILHDTLVPLYCCIFVEKRCFVDPFSPGIVK